MDRASLMDLIEHMYWVNARLMDAADTLPTGRFVVTRAGTVRDLRSTLVHELDVEWSWRLALQGRPESELGADVELRAVDYPDVASLRDHWARDEAEMRAWLATVDQDALDRTVSPVLSSRALPLWQFLYHIVNHATIQQADAAALLTAAGASPGEIGYLDFVWDRRSTE